MSHRRRFRTSQSIEEVVKAAEDHYGSIDVLVNNAGIGYFAAVEESDEEFPLLASSTSGV